MQSPAKKLAHKNLAWAMSWMLAGLCIYFSLSPQAQAVPAFARQTGMNCNSCHIGTDPVPLFTHAGRLFAMKGYTRPYVRERIRNDGTTVEDNPQYGGEYLALNWNDFFSFRFRSELIEDGHRQDGSSRDTTSRPLARAAIFFTGAITDWLGLWTEIGYLGNQALVSVTEGQEGPTTKNYFAYDEYRLAASWDLDPKGFFGPKSFWGVSIGNEHPNVDSQFNYPLFLPDFWYNGQGGVGNSKEIMNFSVHGFFHNKWWLQLAAVTGADNNNWSDGHNQYLQVAYNWTGRQRNDLWIVAEYYRGNDFPSIMTAQRESLICPATCPPGIVDTNLSFTTVPGFTASPIAGAPIEVVDDFSSYKLGVHQAVADQGNHTWYAAANIHQMDQDFVSGAEVTHSMYGVSVRYFWKRTYGFEAYYRDDIEYEYTTPAGQKIDTYSKAIYGINLLFYPAMNFTVHLDISPRIQNIVYRDPGQEVFEGPIQSPNFTIYQGDGDSYRLGFEYNF